MSQMRLRSHFVSGSRSSSDDNDGGEMSSGELASSSTVLSANWFRIDSSISGCRWTVAPRDWRLQKTMIASLRQRRLCRTETLSPQWLPSYFVLPLTSPLQEIVVVRAEENRGRQSHCGHPDELLHGPLPLEPVHELHVHQRHLQLAEEGQEDKGHDGDEDQYLGPRLEAVPPAPDAQDGDVGVDDQVEQRDDPVRDQPVELAPGGPPQPRRVEEDGVERREDEVPPHDLRDAQAHRGGQHPRPEEEAVDVEPPDHGRDGQHPPHARRPRRLHTVAQLELAEDGLDRQRNEDGVDAEGVR
eukprot:CAMPEP_0114530578 /NCGR_PEP_ID=MMETSP0109-20121206/25529_1 /TAXON_ID=29199 /ORGANISM="Chlorarachnion reptans, Strain CCCM449" /LENGTH=299 /DNA_ID=CAMNT_0001713229 /DNA_START=197 /DNA_END=1094 /DNA_ORIENTATION=-